MNSSSTSHFFTFCHISARGQRTGSVQGAIETLFRPRLDRPFGNIKTFIFAAAILISFQSFGQATIKGKIKNEGNESVPSATVQINDQIAISGVDGEFSI